jgi:hypothetical protein
MPRTVEVMCGLCGLTISVTFPDKKGDDVAVGLDFPAFKVRSQTSANENWPEEECEALTNAIDAAEHMH